MKMTSAARPSLVASFLQAAMLSALALVVFLNEAAAQDGKQQFAELSSCKLDSGQEIAGCRIGYRTWGKLNAERSNAVLFPTWFGGTSEYLAGLVSEKGLVDPAKFFVVAVDALGNGVSSSPSNSTTQPRMTFPSFTIRDMVRSQYRLATEILHIKHLHAVVGISMGGMQTFEWMVDYPEFMDCAVPIVGSPRLTSYDLLFWNLEDELIRTDPGWHGGDYQQNPQIRLLAILSAMNGNTPGYYAREVGRESFPASFAAYGHSGPGGFDTNNRLYQTDAMIHLDVARGGSMEDAAKRVHARVFIVPSEQDHIVNPGPALDFAKLLGAKTQLLTSDCGHLAYECEAEKLNPVVQAFLDGR